MTLEQTAQGRVQAVVIHNGRLLLVGQENGGTALPSGLPQPAESAEACAARLVYELTGYLVDGSSTLERRTAQGTEVRAASVVCQLLTEDPSDGAHLAREQIHWVSLAEAVRTATELPPAVMNYLKGHTSV
ncbi:NUDIX hydrolase [Streptomyces sp. NPDC046821]|uniref:NUDIX hydrolase n=1 Tax=Streptomyces sp. NPDC046821 TaxID=3154702 RepID=UPI00340A7A6B